VITTSRYTNPRLALPLPIVCMWYCVVLSWQPHQLWSIDGQLVRELLFEDVIHGVCFANQRADLLVGFADSVQYVNLRVLTSTTTSL